MHCFLAAPLNGPEPRASSSSSTPVTGDMFLRAAQMNGLANKNGDEYAPVFK
jgi:hypothetical protein